jgi:hypothetical protein
MGYRDNACEPHLGAAAIHINLSSGGNWAAHWAVEDHGMRQTRRFAEPRVGPFHQREPVDGRAFNGRYQRIAAIASVSNLRLRLSGTGACF